MASGPLNYAVDIKLKIVKQTKQNNNCVTAQNFWREGKKCESLKEK